MLFVTMAQAQRIDVKDFRLDGGATDAVKYQVRDANGTPCALVKVRLEFFALAFEGDVIKSEYKGEGEHWVYMSAGATWMRVKSTVAPPLDYKFNQPLESNRTYIMQLKHKATSVTTPIYRPQKTKTNTYAWERRSFYVLNYSFPNAALGNTFGMGKRWGWYGSLMLGIRGKEQTTYTYNYWYNGNIMDEEAENKTDIHYNFHMVFGPTYRITDDIILTGGVGFTFGRMDRLPGGGTYELGIMFQMSGNSILSIAFEDVVDVDGGHLPAIKMGLGFSWVPLMF